MKSVVSYFLYTLCLNHTVFVEKTPKPGVEVKEPKIQRTNTKAAKALDITGQMGSKTSSIMSMNLVDNYDKYYVYYSNICQYIGVSKLFCL